MSWRARIAWYQGREHLTAKATSLARHWYYASLDRKAEGRGADGSADRAGELNAASARRGGSSSTGVLGLGRKMAMSSWASGRRRRYPPDAGHDQVAYEQWLVARGEPVRLPERSVESVVTRGADRVRQEGPLFSIVVPVFRPPLWSLERCVASVLGQPFDDFELKICDDGGGDPGVIALLRRCEAADNRLELIVSDHNGGISDATNSTSDRYS